MFRRVRQLRISLAAKCQLLFGIAAVVIIAAALFVPWQRMEQLTEQLNEKAAQSVARIAVAEHVRRYSTTQPAGTTQPFDADRAPDASSADPAPLVVDDLPVLPVRILSVDRIRADEARLRFEANALDRFERRPDYPFHSRLYDREDGTRYRFAEPLFARGVCLTCHASPATLPIAPIYPPDGTTGPATTQPTTALLGVVSVEIPSQISTRQALLNRVFMLLAGLLAGTLAIVILYLIITRLILQPVRVLQETAEKVSQGDLNIRSDINSGDEFQQLSETFNTMLRNLKDSADQLRSMNKSLDQRLGQLAESNVALFESNRLKTEFLAAVSHELRTPLNSILGFADLLKELAGSDPKLQRYVANIGRSGKHLLDLINDLLDLAKIEAGRMDVRVEAISLSDMFEGLVNLLRPLCESRQITIVPLVTPSVPILRTDPSKLQQVLYNLLSNAIKFSPTGGRIDLQARLEPAQKVRISVTDTGPGIPADKQDVIFEKFRQLDQSATREHGGTGLGLAIARELVRLLEGTIAVESTPGQGATFYVILPHEITSQTHDVRAQSNLAN
jgi:signal transduction histidine kinase